MNETYEGNAVTVQVLSCQRCNSNHELKFSKLDNPRDDYNYWAMCPVKNQPLTMMVVNTP